VSLVVLALGLSLLAVPLSVSAGPSANGPRPISVTPRYTARPIAGLGAAGVGPAASVTTVPFFQGSITALGKKYTYQIVGKDPSIKHTGSTTVTVDVIPLALKFDDTNTVFDPTKPDPKCSPKGSALKLTTASPVFKPVPFKVGQTNIGKVQYPDAFQREQYAKYTLGPKAVSPGYHLVLKPVVHPVEKVTVPTNVGFTGVIQGSCAKLGVLDIGSLDGFLQKQFFPGLKYVDPTHLAMILVYNVIECLDVTNTNTCGILGYHSGFQVGPSAEATSAAKASKVQTYGISDYDSTGVFKGTGDVSVLTHEVQEWVDDPFVNNATPPWGHIGQVQKCQANLEVGDPLSGTVIPYKLGGFTYHLQEQAFFSWFYRQKPSLGINGWYSNNGTFKKTQPVCH
jgi:hypothetical protein